MSMQQVIMEYSIPEPNTGCWLWIGPGGFDGYGQLSGCKAHIPSYIAFKGPIPPGTEIDHLCRVTFCVNPDHLEAVSHTTNVRRGMATKITDEIAALIRLVGYTQPQIVTAAQFSVSQSTISRVLN